MTDDRRNFEERLASLGAAGSSGSSDRVAREVSRRIRATPQRHRPGPPWAALAAALAAVAIGAGVIGIFVLRTTTAAPTPPPAPSAPPPPPTRTPIGTASPTATASPTPSASPTASARPTASTVAIRAGDSVVATEPVGLQTTAGKHTLETGERAYVIDAGSDRLRLQVFGTEAGSFVPDGFFALTSPIGDAHLRVATPECPSTAGAPIDILAVAGLDEFDRLACFGGREITVGPVQLGNGPRWGGATGAPVWLDASVAPWLAGIDGADFRSGLRFHLAPGTDALPDGTWLTVTGHFDDATASTCRGGPAGGTPADAVLWCREQFVATGARRTAAAARELPGTWSVIPSAPIGRRDGAAVAWTGSQMLVWGGWGTDPTLVAGLLRGALFDPKTSTWHLTSPAPIAGRAGPAFGPASGPAAVQCVSRAISTGAPASRGRRLLSGR